MGLLRRYFFAIATTKGRCALTISSRPRMISRRALLTSAARARNSTIGKPMRRALAASSLRSSATCSP